MEHHPPVMFSKVADREYWILGGWGGGPYQGEKIRN